MRCRPRAMIPTPMILHRETPSPVTPLGAKGVAEGNSMSTPVCIANAVADALGVADLTLPLTPARVAGSSRSKRRAMFDLGRSFLASVERSPDALAIVHGERRLTYAEWYAEIGRVADGLAALSLRRGDRLAVILQNRIEIASLHWACQFLGIVMTPLNWRMKAEELDYCLADAEAGAIVFDAVAVDAVAGARRARDLPRVAIGDAEDGTCRFDDWPASDCTLTPRARPEDLSVLLYTSGTTGRPKGVPRRHRAERAAALAHIRTKPLWPQRAHLGRDAALSHDGDPLAVGDGAGRRRVHLPAAL